MSEPHPRMVPNAPVAAESPVVHREPREEKVDFRDVMPHTELPAPEVPPDPTLVELIADEFMADDRRTTDFSWLLK